MRLTSDAPDYEGNYIEWMPVSEHEAELAVLAEKLELQHEDTMARLTDLRKALLGSYGRVPPLTKTPE